jgi:hypothetical protein
MTNPEGHFELRQSGIIEKIITECGLEENSKKHATPAITTILPMNKNGPPRELL